MSAALGWFKLLKVVVRTSDSFVQKTNYLSIERAEVQISSV